MFQARPTDERYVTGGGGRASVTLCDKGGGGVKIGQKKRYVIVERPLNSPSDKRKRYTTSSELRIELGEPRIELKEPRIELKRILSWKNRGLSW